MTQEDKELLLKDLSARLYYRPTVLLSGREHCILCGIDGDEVYLNVDSDSFHIESIKPYLRPMSSMTEEELYKFSYLMQQPNVSEIKKWLYSQEMSLITFEDSLIAFDWLNAHHFDYRGLIEKGLALEAPKDMYNLKGK